MTFLAKEVGETGYVCAARPGCGDFKKKIMKCT